MTRNARSFLAVAAFAIACKCCSTYAQIQVAESFEVGQPIIATAAIDGAAVADWRVQQVVALPGGAEVLGLDEAAVVPIEGGRTAHVWAKAGKYRIELTVATVAAGAPTLKRHNATFIVGEVPEPAPAPEPIPPPAPPVPTPPTPAPLPEPKPGTLGALVPDAAARATLAEFYADMATLTRNGAYTTTGHFRTAQALGAKTLQQSGKLPSVAAINKPVSDKIAAAIGLDDVALDDTKRAALAAVLDSIAAEFRGG